MNENLVLINTAVATFGSGIFWMAIFLKFFFGKLQKINFKYPYGFVNVAFGFIFCALMIKPFAGLIYHALQIKQKSYQSDLSYVLSEILVITFSGSALLILSTLFSAYVTFFVKNKGAFQINEKELPALSKIEVYKKRDFVLHRVLMLSLLIFSALFYFLIVYKPPIAPLKEFSGYRLQQSEVDLLFYNSNISRNKNIDFKNKKEWYQDGSGKYLIGLEEGVVVDIMYNCMGGYSGPSLGGVDCISDEASIINKFGDGLQIYCNLDKKDKNNYGSRLYQNKSLNVSFLLLKNKVEVFFLSSKPWILHNFESCNSPSPK